MSKLNLKSFKVLRQNEIGLLEGILDPEVFSADSVAVYEGHIPHVAFILLDGEVRLITKKTKDRLCTGAVIGIKELLSDSPIPYSLEFLQGSKVYVLDKSTVKELSEKKGFKDLFFSFTD